MWQILLSLFPLTTSANKCYGLSIEGGGSHGAYEAGAINAIVSSVPADTVKWDFIHGVSTGALNTGAYSQFPIGQELQMTEFTVQTWRNLGGSANVWNYWNNNPIDWLNNEYGLISNDPLRKYIQSVMTKPLQRPVSIGTTNISTATFTTFDESLSLSDFQESIICSSSVPGLFPHQDVFGGVYADGMILHNMDVASVVNKCRAKGVSDQDIVIDLIFDGFPQAYDADLGTINTLQVMDYVYDIQAADGELRFLTEAELAYPHVNFRYVLFPSKPVGFPFNFDPTNIESLIQLGMSDGKKLVQDYQENQGFEKFKEAYKSRMRIVTAE